MDEINWIHLVLEIPHDLHKVNKLVMQYSTGNFHLANVTRTY